MSTGTVKGFEVGKNRDGTKDVILLQVAISDPDDIQTVELMTHAGDDTIPPDGSRVTIFDVGEAWKIAIASNDGIKSTMKAGEKQIYSSANGIIKAFTKYLEDGNLELNGNTDNVTAFQDMKDAFDTLKSDLNKLVTNFNAHTHSGIVSGPSNSGPISGSPGIPSTADMSSAKVPTVKVP